MGERGASLALKLCEMAGSGVERAIGGLYSTYHSAWSPRMLLEHGFWLSDIALVSCGTIFTRPPTVSSTEQMRKSITYVVSPSLALAFAAGVHAGST
jgi:hypothetical protein